MEQIHIKFIGAQLKCGHSHCIIINSNSIEVFKKHNAQVIVKNANKSTRTHTTTIKKNEIIFFFLFDL